jgi:hypothetical protein
MSEPKEYRLLHKKDGTYVLQVKIVYTYIDYGENKIKYRYHWSNVETVEEE